MDSKIHKQIIKEEYLNNKQDKNQINLIILSNRDLNHSSLMINQNRNI